MLLGKALSGADAFSSRTTPTSPRDWRQRRHEGRPGNDLLDGNDGHDELLGEAGNDKLDRRRRQRQLIGGSGNDTLVAGTAATR